MIIIIMVVITIMIIMIIMIVMLMIKTKETSQMRNSFVSTSGVISVLDSDPTLAAPPLKGGRRNVFLFFYRPHWT